MTTYKVELEVSIVMRGSRGGDRGPDPPPEKSQKYRISEQYWSGSPDNDTATKPFKVGPSSARKRNAIEMPLKWRFAGGPMMVRL